MNVDIAKKGHSFKGAFAYYLHDKGAQTAERVAWVETRNLAHDDPAFAQSVMIATARQADALKEAAGIRATGRKATAGPVYAFALSWHPEEANGVDRAEMIRTADAALKILKADHLQAVIVCHQDTQHPHVHVIVNRVNPENGILEGFSKDYDRLDAWADAYERARGKIVSPNRAKKYDDRKKRAQDKAPRREPQEAALSLAPDKVAPAKQCDPVAVDGGKSRSAILAALQAEQKVRHKQEWADLAAANKVRREAVYGERVDFKAIAAQHRAETRPLWSELGKEQAAERRAFGKREKRVLGIVRNAIETARDQQRRGVANDYGFLTMAIAYTLAPKARRALFDARQRAAKECLAKSLEVALIAKFDAVKARRAGKLAEVRRVYDAARAALIERQNAETAKIREAWRQLYTEREKTADGGRPVSWRRRAAVNGNQAKAPQPVTAGFGRVAQLANAKQEPGANPPSRLRGAWNREAGPEHGTDQPAQGQRSGLRREVRSIGDRLRRPGRDFDRER
jgi:hypothetical protein